MAKDVKELKCLNFNVLFAKDYHYFEYYPSYEALDLFLQGVPIFEDYDSEKDNVKLKEYIAQNTTQKGIALARHRIVLVAQKII